MNSMNVRVPNTRFTVREALTVTMNVTFSPNTVTNIVRNTTRPRTRPVTTVNRLVDEVRRRHLRRRKITPNRKRVHLPNTGLPVSRLLRRNGNTRRVKQHRTNTTKRPRPAVKISRLGLTTKNRRISKSTKTFINFRNQEATQSRHQFTTRINVICTIGLPVFPPKMNRISTVRIVNKGKSTTTTLITYGRVRHPVRPQQPISALNRRNITI